MTKFKKLTKLFLPIMLVIFLAAGCTKQAWGPEVEVADREQVQASFKVEGVDRGDQLFNFYVDENKTVRDMLLGGHTATIDEITGEVRSINDVSPEAGGRWVLYVNGASTTNPLIYKPVDKDKLEWRKE